MYKCSLFIFLLLTGMYSIAQESDFGIWVDISVSKELTNKLSVSLEEGLRLENNASQIGSFTSDLGLKYELIDNFDVSVGYRYSIKPETNGIFNKYRFNLDLSYSYELKPFEFRYRNRTTLSKNNYINEWEDVYPAYNNRNKIEVAYNIRGVKTDPFIGVESNHLLDRYNTFYLVESMRYYIGVDWKLKYDMKLSLSYIFEREEKKTIENMHVFSLSTKKKF